ncbi:MetQ/NlpA family ABC transporter substrate-binding protein [Clostridium cylindrosporum]|uniref:D-methionine-binding lipoprotein MetQ n=1 Tax=Clostridium cylindrosporum DSM 605 TaxID=1121307 RepID=A0A0J8DDU7_CLOCY|nr:MetQ/NlpA family ABC transporter substrate-binding protein [Clostridium cylindrosporum]KMT22409.1 D-methionine-binding lipoprotein MetQ [Clostridium cylindrosporum DSM 605]
MKRKFKKALALGLISLISIASLVGCQSKTKETQGDAKVEEKKTITMGSSPGPYDVLFQEAVKPILEKKGYTIKTVDFSKFQMNNTALAEGSVDFNVSQHSAYMKTFNKEKNANLVALTPIPTVPAGLFSANHKLLDEVKKGSKVAIPQDPSNCARGLALLQKAGWIKLKEGIELTKVTLNDVAENKKDIEIVPMDSSQIPRVLKDVDFGVLPGSVVYASKVDPKTSLLAEDVLKDLQLVLVVNGKNKDAEWAKAIADAYRSDEFKTYMKEHNKDNYWFIPDEIK